MSGGKSWLDQKGSGVAEVRGAGVPGGVRRYSAEPGSPSLPLCLGQTPGSPETWLKVMHASDGPADSVRAAKPTIPPP